MDKTSKMKQWVKTWIQAGKALEKIRKERLPATQTAEAIEALAGSFEWAMRACPPRRSSGLTEMQRFFRKLHLR